MYCITSINKKICKTLVFTSTHTTNIFNISYNGMIPYIYIYRLMHISYTY